MQTVEQGKRRQFQKEGTVQLKDNQIKQQIRWTLWSMVMSVVSVKFMVLS